MVLEFSLVEKSFLGLEAMRIDPDVWTVCVIAFCSVTQAAFCARHALAVGQALNTVGTNASQLASGKRAQADCFGG